MLIQNDIKNEKVYYSMNLIFAEFNLFFFLLDYKMGTHTLEEVETTRRITRATLKSEPEKSSTSPLKPKKSSGNKSKSKKVKFQEPKQEVCNKNTSLFSDEGRN